MNKFALMVAILAAFLLSACSGAVPWNDQNRAGIDDLSIQYSEDGKPKEIRFVSGKEKEAVEITYNAPDGTTATYKAGRIAAFEGQRYRAETEQKVSGDVKDAAPAAFDTLKDIIAPP